MVELRYYRRPGHAQHDSQEYADPAEVAAWEEKDPILTYRTRLLEERWATSTELDAIQAGAVAEIASAAEQALSEPLPEVESAVERVYTNVEMSHPWTRMPQPDPLPT